MGWGRRSNDISRFEGVYYTVATGWVITGRGGESQQRIRVLASITGQRNQMQPGRQPNDSTTGFGQHTQGSSSEAETSWFAIG